MRIKRLLVIVVAVIVVVPVGAGALMVATFDPNSYKPELIKAAEKAAGRQVSISGKLHLGLALTPTLSASGITIDNPQGYPDSVMAKLKRIKAQVALLPLLAHRLDILQLTLVRPQITLERNAAGRGNWVFSKQGGASAGAATPTASSSGSGTSSPRRMPQIALKSVSIEHAMITYKGVQHPGSPPAVTTVSIPHLTGHASTLASPIVIHADARYDGVPLTIHGTTGPLARFTGGGGGKPWPVDILLAAKNAKLALQGTIADPRAMRGADVAMRADIPDLSALDPFAGGISLPPLKKVTLTAKVTQPRAGRSGDRRPANGRSAQAQGGHGGAGAVALPEITDVKLTAGRSKLNSWRKGLRLASLDVSMSSLDKQAQINLSGHYQGKPLGLSGQVGPIRPVLAALLGDVQASASTKTGRSAGGQQGGQAAQAGTHDRFKVNLQGHVADGTVNVSGGVAAPARFSGVALKVATQIPDLGKLSDLVGAKLPSITNLSLSFLLTDPGGQPLTQAVGVSSLAATADQFQVGGAGKLIFGKVPDLQAVIRAPRIDLTAIKKAMPAPAGPKASASTSKTAPPAAQPAGSSGQSTQTVSGSTPPMLIPSTAIPFGELQHFDANVEVTISRLLYGGHTYSGIVSHALVQKGKLTVRPIAAQLPGGSVSGTMTVDSTASPPSIHVTESAPSFHLEPMLALLGHPNGGSGTVQLFANLKGAGDTPRDIAGTLSGKFGIAMVNGEVDGSILRQLLGGTVSAAGLPANVIGAQGPVSVPCFATRLDAKSGTATLRALALDSSRLFMTGTGRIDLGAERLDLVINPRVDMGGGRSAPVPVAIRGTLAKPKAGPASPQDYAETAGAIAKQFGGQKAQGLLGEFAQKLGLSRSQPGPQTCAGALSLARMGHSGPQPSNSAMQNTPAPSAANGQSGGGGSSSGGGSGPQNLLNSLFH